MVKHIYDLHAKQPGPEPIYMLGSSPDVPSEYTINPYPQSEIGDGCNNQFSADYCYGWIQGARSFDANVNSTDPITLRPYLLRPCFIKATISNSSSNASMNL